MEGVDGIYIVEVGRSSLISDVHRMLKRQVPYGEGLELGIAGNITVCSFVVELRKTYGHLSATRTGGSNHHQRTARLHIFILTKTLV